MDTLYPRCAGIDVHKGNVVVCVRCGDRPGKVLRGDPHLRDHDRPTCWPCRTGWPSHGVTHVAMESTGVYWKPVFNILEGGVLG